MGRSPSRPRGPLTPDGLIPSTPVSVDEKPGVQALGLSAPDLPPRPGKTPAIGRDYEYIRHGTVSILAGIDLHSGHIFACVEDRHRSLEFSGLRWRSSTHAKMWPECRSMPARMETVPWRMYS